MGNLRIGEILKASGGKLVRGSPRIPPTSITIDSRALRKGEIFLALKGRRFDGHDFVETALAKGASGAIVEGGQIKNLKKFLPDYPRAILILVKDTRRALGDIAAFYRNKFSTSFLAITGSCGKTTTKEMVASILQQKYKVLKTEKNFNNLIGVPLTLFRLKPEHEVGVIEMGMSFPGEIATLTRMLNPRIGVITNVNPAHLEYFSSIKEVTEAKAELINNMKEGGIVVLNRDNSRTYNLRERVKGELITFGIHNKGDYFATQIKELPDGKCKFYLNNRLGIELSTLGIHNVYNALAAIASISPFHIEESLIKRGLESFRPQPMRMEVMSFRGIKVINDTYNANPYSMKALIKTLISMKARGRRILVVGDMLELGKWSKKAHKEIGKVIGNSHLNILITVGKYSKLCADTALKGGMNQKNIFVHTTPSTAGEDLLHLMREGDLIAIKGSRSMHLEEIVERIRLART